VPVLYKVFNFEQSIAIDFILDSSYFLGPHY